MKKLLFTLISLVMAMGIQAQAIHIRTIQNSDKKQVCDTVFCNTSDPDTTYKVVLKMGKIIQAESITLPSTATIIVPKSFTLAPTILPDYATFKTCVWSSSNENVATVNASGVVSAINGGTAEITARTKDGSALSATCTVTVKDFFFRNKFSVANNKKVFFAKGNLYWNGSGYFIEEKQTDFTTSWDANHVDRFFWTSLRDYQSGTDSYMPYKATFGYSQLSPNDAFWCGEDNTLTLSGVSGAYVLSKSEWEYIFQTRTNASNLYKSDVTVTDDGKEFTGCLIIAPDNFTGTLPSSCTLQYLNDNGIVCLPNMQYRHSTTFDGTSYSYWTSTVYPNNQDAYKLSSNGTFAQYYRSDGDPIRLVITAE